MQTLLHPKSFYSLALQPVFMSVWRLDDYRGGHMMGDNTNLFVHSLPPLHIPMHTHTYTYTHMHAHLHTHACTFARACTFANTYVHMHAHLQTHTHACTFAHTYACMPHTQLYTQSGETAIHIAIREEREDIVELLLEANADLDLPKKVISHTTHCSHGDMT